MSDKPRFRSACRLQRTAPSSAPPAIRYSRKTFTDFELVICDNCSTDATEQICRGTPPGTRACATSATMRNLGPAPNYNRCLSCRAASCSSGPPRTTTVARIHPISGRRARPRPEASGSTRARRRSRRTARRCTSTTRSWNWDAPRRRLAPGTLQRSSNHRQHAEPELWCRVARGRVAAVEADQGQVPQRRPSRDPGAPLLCGP